MKRLIVLLVIFFVYAHSSLIGSNFTQSDIQILEDLDIESSFINDYKLKKIYSQYQGKGNSYRYVESLNEALLFIPRIKDILRQEGIPDVFIYMAMAESNFEIDAKSSSKARGLWQFMDRTGSRFGLRNDIYVDERMDLIKSTYAATKYLNALHNRFGKWYLAAIAYNCGEGRLIEALTRATLDFYVKEYPELRYSDKIQKYRKTIKDYQQKKVKFFMLKRVYKKVLKYNIRLDVADLLKEQSSLYRQYLPKESRGYIRKIISLAMMNSQNFINNIKNEHLLNIGISKTIATVPIKGGLHLKNISKSINMKYDSLIKLNKHIKQSIIPPTDKYYTINIPYDKLTYFNQNKDTIQDTKFVIHIVNRGDTLSYLALKYGLSIALIKNYNNLDSNKLALLQKLIIPISSDMARKIKINSRKYIVKNGDSLSSISKKYNIDIKKLMKDNKMKTTLLKIGDRIVIR